MAKGAMPKGAGDGSNPKTQGDAAAAEEAKKKQEALGTLQSSSRALAVLRYGRDGGGGSSTQWPTLTCTNYNSWSLLMRVILQVRHLWDVIETGEAEYDNDRAEMEAVPQEMIPMLAVKKTAKEAWDTIKTIRVGAERVRESKAQVLRKQYESIRFKPGESVDDFGVRLQ
ncbi:hypothetical protein MPTK1_4g23860 [Marchantia polymorpha subsp. ruderalis]|uniref:DUF4219 domain-containing protein n=1 Tax=Marchantia polymorpha subsp. ruderalis TaxID=1480154 RepID=A0AAF6BD50_MARPO|nr:hypothetical protein Mp_4g23860 [Marchantia polymorpha subsp. ruderalis]